MEAIEHINEFKIVCVVIWMVCWMSMMIIKNGTQKLNLNAAQIRVAFPVLVQFPRACSSCHICFSAMYKYAQY